MSKRAEGQDELDRAVLEHLRKYGSSQWSLVKDKFPDVPNSRFWRTIKRLQGQAALMPNNVRKVLAATAKAQDHLPIVVPTSLVEREPERVSASIDYMYQMQEVFRVADAMRDFSLTADGKVKLPMFLLQSGKLRNEAVRTFAQCSQYLNDQKMMQLMFEEVVRMIGEEAPELQRKLIDGLEKINRKFGATPSSTL